MTYFGTGDSVDASWVGTVIIIALVASPFVVGLAWRLADRLRRGRPRR